MLSQAEKGGVQNTIQNCVTVLQNDPILADSIRLNLLSERIDIVKADGLAAFWPYTDRHGYDVHSS